MRLEPVNNPIEEKAGEVAGLVAGWAADAEGSRNRFSYSYLSDRSNWTISTYLTTKEILQLEPNTDYTFHAQEITADTDEEWTVLNLMDGTDGIPPWGPSSTNRLVVIYNRKQEPEPLHNRKVTFTTPQSGKVYLEYYDSGGKGNGPDKHWVTEKLIKAQIVRGLEVPEWRPSPEDAVAGYMGNGESTSPLLPHDPNKPVQVHGVGFPNGKVAAPVGSIYTDTEATNGAIRWIKTTGTGNTGWVIEYGDIQRRRITPGLYNDTDGIILDEGTGFISRTNDLVSLTLYNLKVDREDAASSLGAQLPPGFSPTMTLNFPGVIAGNAGARMSVTVSGAVRIYGLATQTYHDHFFSLVWATNDPWPTTLPGTPS